MVQKMIIPTMPHFKHLWQISRRLDEQVVKLDISPGGVTHHQPLSSLHKCEYCGTVHNKTKCDSCGAPQTKLAR